MGRFDLYVNLTGPSELKPVGTLKNSEHKPKKRWFGKGVVNHFVLPAYGRFFAEWEIQF